MYQVGDRVYGYRGGQWYLARVAVVLGDGQYELNWENGYKQDRVKGRGEMHIVEPGGKSLSSLFIQVGFIFNVATG